MAKNVLAPTTELQGRLTPFHVIRTSEVTIDPSETYEITEWQDGRKTTLYALGKPALTRIAQAAGVEFDIAQTGLVGMPTKDYLQFRAVARMRLPDGTVVERPGTVEWFYELEVQPVLDEVESLKAQADTEQGDAKKRTLAKMYGKKKQAHDALAKRVPMVETKAMLRAIRAILPIKPKYTLAELTEAFVVPRIDVVPDLENPSVRRLMESRALDINTALYGTPGGSAPALAPAPFEQEYPSEVGEAEWTDDSVPFEEDEPLNADDVISDLGATVIGGEPPADEPVAEEPPAPQYLIDPGEYVIADARSKFRGWKLHTVEADAPGYCLLTIKMKRGSQELQDACMSYLESYQPEAWVEVNTFD